MISRLRLFISDLRLYGCTVLLLALFATSVLVPPAGVGAPKAKAGAIAGERMQAAPGDKTPTNNAAGSNPKAAPVEEPRLMALSLAGESHREVRFQSPEILFSEIRFSSAVPGAALLRTSLGAVASALPHRFTLVGQRPSGTS